MFEIYTWCEVIRCGGDFTYRGAKELPVKDILIGVKSSIDLFAREAEQFDDITMLGVRYNG